MESGTRESGKRIGSTVKGSCIGLTKNTTKASLFKDSDMARGTTIGQTGKCSQENGKMTREMDGGFSTAKMEKSWPKEFGRTTSSEKPIESKGSLGFARSQVFGLV